MSRESAAPRPPVAAARPRYHQAPLPPYSYVPGCTPHPVSDPRGHLHGVTHAPPAPLDPERWRESSAYLLAVDLFNHGFYWEAHESWESLWHAAGRTGAIATWCKALIKLAAAGVKVREGNAVGVERHARRALQLLDDLRGLIPPDETHFCGIELAAVQRVANQLHSGASQFTSPQPTLLLPQWFPLNER